MAPLSAHASVKTSPYYVKSKEFVTDFAEFDLNFIRFYVTKVKILRVKRTAYVFRIENNEII